MKLKTTWGKAVSKILPGDYIHDVAPINQVSPFGQSGKSRMEQVTAAEKKRIRKLAKRRATP